MKKLVSLNEDINEKLGEIEKPYADDEHSEVDPKDGARKIKPDFIVEFTAKRNELFALDNELEIDTATIDEIGAEKISPNVLNLLSFMLDEDEDEEATEE